MEGATTMTQAEALKLAIEGVKACLLPHPTLAIKCADIIAILRGEKVAQPLPAPKEGGNAPGIVSRKALADYLGLELHAINYHARQGRLVPVRAKGSRRVLGFTRESVRSFLGIDNLDQLTKHLDGKPAEKAALLTEKLIKRNELAALLGVNARTIDRYRYSGKIKAHYYPKSGQTMGYTRASIRECFGNII